MEWLADPTAWLGLGTLILLELVLGIDNLIFIAILVERLPPQHRGRARILGLSLAFLMRVAMLSGISWLESLAFPLVTVFGVPITIRGLVLISGGAFLIVKATTELHGRIEGASEAEAGGAAPAALWQAVIQIVVIDAVFSLDSVITAVGMADNLAVMIIAVFVAILAMMLVSGPLARFVAAHPSVVILCLSFLLTIGFSLVVEGVGFEIPKGYLYAAIAFSVLIEALNQVARRRQLRRAAGTDLRARTAEAVLRTLAGVRAGPHQQEYLDALMAARRSRDVFTPTEQAMVRGVLGMAERPVSDFMRPAAELTWVEAEAPAQDLSRTILQRGQGIYPVCSGSPAAFLGLARGADLVRDLLETGRIAPQTVDRAPLAVPAGASALQVADLFRRSGAEAAVVTDAAGRLAGLVRPIDLLHGVLATGAAA